MNWFRVTKYDPALQGSVNLQTSENSWTSFSDVGKIFGAKQLTIERYLDVENSYIRFYTDLLKTLSIKELRIFEMEIYDDEGSRWLNKSHVSSREFILIFQDILREHLWGKLIGKDGFEIHFGYDLYTYFGMNGYFDGNTKGDYVFVERIEKSPYSRE